MSTSTKNSLRNVSPSSHKVKKRRAKISPTKLSSRTNRRTKAVKAGFVRRRSNLRRIK